MGFLTFLPVLIRVIRVNLWLSFFFQLVPSVGFDQRLTSISG